MRRQHQRTVFDAFRLLDLIVQLTFLTLKRAALSRHFRRFFHATIGLRCRTKYRQLGIQLLTLRNQRLSERIGIAGEFQRHLVELVELVFIGISRHLPFYLIENFLHFRQLDRGVNLRRRILLRRRGSTVISQCHRRYGQGH